MNEKLINNAMLLAEDNTKSVMDNLYIDNNGFHCCKKCNTRKQVEIFVFSKSQRVYCDCKCEQEQYQKNVKSITNKKRLLNLKDKKDMDLVMMTTIVALKKVKYHEDMSKIWKK